MRLTEERLERLRRLVKDFEEVEVGCQEVFGQDCLTIFQGGTGMLFRYTDTFVVKTYLLHSKYDDVPFPLHELAEDEIEEYCSSFFGWYGRYTTTI